MEVEVAMTTCRDFEIAIEMRLHGALADERAAELDEHLASCDACRRFETLAQTTKGTMNMRANTVASKMDWERVWENIKATERDLHRDLSWGRTLPAITIGVAICVVGLWVAGSRNAWFNALFPCLFIPAFIWHQRRGIRRRLQELKQVERVRDETVQYYRKDVERRIRVLRRSMLGAPLFGLFFMGAGLYWAFSATSIAFYVALGIVFILLPLYTRIAVLPRLQRERKELE
jgi:hypothetical protein